MTHRSNRWIVPLLLALLIPFSIAQAQSPEFEWTRWDAIINLRTSTDQMEIVETQEFLIEDGTVRFGTRSWIDPVELQAVFYAGASGGTVELEQGSSNAEGTYTVEQNGGETTLQYNLPEAAGAGDSFVIQMNYLATLPAEGLVDWRVIPGEHAAPIRSSTVTLNFPEGEAPDAGLVRVVSGDAQVQSDGDSIIIQSNGEIPIDEMFQIQMPFGAGVGAAGSTGNNGSAEQQPNSGFGGDTGSSGIVPGNERVGVTPGADNGLGLGIDTNTLLMLGCVFGLMLLFGGGGLLRGLGGGLGGLGGLGGGGGAPRGGGLFPGAGRRSNPGSSGGGNSGSTGRGFRSSSRSNRPAPRVRNNKGSGGSAGLG